MRRAGLRSTSVAGSPNSRLPPLLQGAAVRVGRRGAETPGACRFVCGGEGREDAGCALAHVGAPAGANAACGIGKHVGRSIAEFAAAAAPTGGGGSRRASRGGNARGVSVRVRRRRVRTRRARAGSCRSAGRRECGVRDCEARRSLDRRIRGCRRSTQGAAVRVGRRGAGTPGACRFVGGGEGCEHAGRALVHVGAPAGANAACGIAKHVGRWIAEFAAAAAPTGGGGSRRASRGGNARGVSVRGRRRRARTRRARAGSCRSAGRRECGDRAASPTRRS